MRRSRSPCDRCSRPVPREAGEASGFRLDELWKARLGVLPSCRPPRLSSPPAWLPGGDTAGALAVGTAGCRPRARDGPLVASHRDPAPRNQVAPGPAIPFLIGRPLNVKR
jgi:hypothetical protein